MTEPAPAAGAPSRRIAIADAAIAVVAQGGLHGLTHRAVDRHLGLPSGSTSYYHRSREALVAAAVDRLVALDDEDLRCAQDSAQSQPGPPSLVGRAMAVALFERWASPGQRGRLLARLELLVSAARSPEARPILQARQHFAAQAHEALAAAGVGDPRQAVTVVVALFDGLLLGVVLSEGDQPPPDVKQLHRLLGALGEQGG